MRRFVAMVCLLLAGACGVPAEEAAPAPRLPDVLPRSMKGYALYGYVKDGRTWFTLITGTNRLKSFDELDAAEPLLGADGWVRVRVAGVDGAEDLLRRVPSDSGVLVQSIRHVSVAQSSVPADVGAPDEAVLERLRRLR